MTRWIRQLFRRTPVAPVVNTPRARLSVHPLEDRVVPAVTVAALDPLFDTDGIQTYNASGTNQDDAGRAVAIQPDGKIVVAGSVQQGLNDYAWVVWRYNPDGTLDSTFGSSGLRGHDFTDDGGVTLDHRANAVAIQPDGKIVVGGFSSTATNGRDMTVVRLTAGGNFDTTFDGDGIWTRPTRLVDSDEVAALALQSDGNIVLAGYYTFGGSDTDFRVIRLTDSGAVDFDESVAFDLSDTDTDKATAVAIQEDGKLVVAGSATVSSFGTDIAVARLLPSGNPDTTFDGDGELTLRFAEGVFSDSACGVAIQPDGQILIGGSAQTSSGDAIDFGFLRLNPDGTYDTTFDEDGKQTAHFAGNDIPSAMAVQPDGKIVLAGLTIQIASTDSDTLLVRVNSDGTMDDTFDFDGMRQYPFNLGGSLADTLKGVALDPSGRIVAVGSAQTASVGTNVAILRAFGKNIPLVVDSTADGFDGDLASGKFSLREAVTLSNLSTDADAITFTEGLNGGTITLGGTRLEVSTPVSITGPSQGLTLDGNLQSQVFYFDGRTNGTYAARLRNLTITRGQTGDSEETIDGNNSGLFGGGILNDQTHLTLENVSVSNNVSTTFSAGIHNWQGVDSKLAVVNSLFSGNSGTTGGAIYNWTDATVTAVNTTFSGNTASGHGGAIFQGGGVITLTNVTATLNRADSDINTVGTGGFLSILSGTVHLHNSSVAGNLREVSTADEISGTLSAGSSNNIILNAGTAGGLTNGTNGNQVGVNPLLQPLANNGGLTRTHALGQNSPALGKASASVANYSVYDQRGTARDLGAADVGAYEVQHPLAPVGVPTTLALLYAPKPSATANEAFVKGLYQSTLLRAPDAGGLANWLTNLANGMSRDTVANGFVNSTENRRNQVTFYYRYFLSREPDTGGLNGWVTFLQAGADEGQVMTGFILSPEFSGSNNNTQFVNLMYYALLGREADTAGFNDWMNRLATGTSRSTVVFFFLRSEEGLNRVVRSLFQAYLKRDADAGAITNFRTALLNGTTFGQAATNILGSQEFFNNAAANMT